MSKSKLTYFNRSWLSEKVFFLNRSLKVKIKKSWCSYTLSLSIMGRKALSFHKTGAGYRNKNLRINQI